MEKPKKKIISSLAAQPNFEEIDHRLACGWHVGIEASGQRKRYLKLVRKETSNLK